MSKGSFISLEGVVGSGKSTIAQTLVGEIREMGRKAILTREPGGTLAGDIIRTHLLYSEEELGLIPRAELLLFQASRAQHVETVIRSCLEDGVFVVCDRFSDSSLAYQAYGQEGR